MTGATRRTPFSTVVPRSLGLGSWAAARRRMPVSRSGMHRRTMTAGPVPASTSTRCSGEPTAQVARPPRPRRLAQGTHRSRATHDHACPTRPDTRGMTATAGTRLCPSEAGPCPSLGHGWPRNCRPPIHEDPKSGRPSGQRAEGQGFEPWRTVTRPSGFQDRRTRPLCEPSRDRRPCIQGYRHNSIADEPYCALSVPLLPATLIVTERNKQTAALGH